MSTLNQSERAEFEAAASAFIANKERREHIAEQAEWRSLAADAISQFATLSPGGSSMKPWLASKWVAKYLGEAVDWNSP
jgi:hypothetical protein